MAHHVNKYLLSKGHECRVILHHYRGPSYVYEGVDVFPSTGQVDAYRWADIIFTHLDMTQFTCIMAHEVQRPLVHFVHNDIGYSSIFSAPRGNYVVYNSNWIRDKVKYPWPSVVLHPPCDVEHYNVGGDTDGAITLISLNERKGGYMFKKIAEALPDRKFIGVVGSYDNPGVMKLEQGKIIEMMPPNVEVIPNSPDILAVYKRTRLLLMPSDYESWGRTATEAMCNGIPVIVTPTDGLEENCRHAAEYVGTRLDDPTPGEASVKIGTVEQWVRAIKKFDSPEYYGNKSLLCKERAAELNPVRELEALEDFILKATF